MSALIVGGYKEEFGRQTKFTKAEVIPNVTDRDCTLPSLPRSVYFGSLVMTNKTQKILLCGGENNWNKCLTLKDSKWKPHSTLHESRIYAPAVAMPNGVFIFGGNANGRSTWEWLPNGSTGVWKKGGQIPGKYSFYRGCAVKTSVNEIVLIGGWSRIKKVIQNNPKLSAKI